MSLAQADTESFPWDTDALEEMQQAPRHLHEMIRAFCEDHARSVGKVRVDIEVIRELQGSHGGHRAKAGNAATGHGSGAAAGGAHTHPHPDGAQSKPVASPSSQSAQSSPPSPAAQGHPSAGGGAAEHLPASGAAAGHHPAAARVVDPLERLDALSELDAFIDLYAEEGADPLSGAFPRRSPPHVAMPSVRVAPGQLQETWEQALRDVLPQQRRRSLYVHVPFCRCRCSYCPFYLMAYREQDAADYVDLLLRDIELTAAQIPAFDADSGGEYQAIFFGGGTPSDLSADQLTRLLKAFAKHFPLSRDCEITVEGRVRGFDADKAQACRDAGATRISLGVQSFDTAVRQGVGRLADETEVCRSLEALGAIDGLALNIDLMYGLPGQTHEKWAHDLARVNGLGGIRGVDLYELKRIPGSPLTRAQSMGRAEEGLGLADRSRMYADGAAALEGAGWERLSCCHWGRGGNRQNRYNVYAKSGAVCLPFGCCSGGRIGRMSMGGPQEVKDYREALDLGHKPLSSARMLDPLSEVHDRMAGQLEFGRLDPDSVQAGLGAKLEPLLSQWQRCGLLERAPSGWGLTLAGRFWIKEISSRLAKALLV